MLTDLTGVSPLDLSGLFKIAPFNPMDIINESANNMMSQLQAATNVRGLLDTVRGGIALDIANLDLSAMQSYATDMLSHAQDMFVTGFTAPALTSIMPSAVTNPLSSDLLGGLTGELTANSLTQGLFNEGKDLLGGGLTSALGGSGLSSLTGGLSSAMGGGLSSLTSGASGLLSGDLSSLASGAEGLLNSGLGDLAVSGAGMYISAMTGGVVPPTIASSVVGTVADAGLGIIQGETPSLSSIGSDLVGNVVSGYTGGLLGGSGATSLITGALSGSSGLTSTLASSINGMQLGSNSMTSILGETTASSIFSDITGGTFEGITDKVLDSVGGSVVDAISNNGSFDLSNITSAATSFAKSVGGDVLESVGGINLSDTSSLVDGIITKGLDVAKNAGDVSTFGKLLDNFSKDKGIFSSDIISMAENVINNPYNLSNYTNLIDDLGIDVGGILSKGASYGCEAVKSTVGDVAEALGVDRSIVNNVSKLMNEATDSKLFNKLTNVGDRIAKEVLKDDETYRQLSALKDVGEVVFSKNGSSNSYNSGRSSYRKLSRAAEQIFNNGKSFGDNTGTKWRFDSDITKAIDEARWVLR